jgi:RNA polymerase sigma factor (sigma-70 family)
MTPIEQERGLVDRICGGDMEAFAFFLKDFGAIAKSVFKDFEQPDELLQNFAVQLWENDWARLRQWRGTGSLRGFVRSVARNQALDAYRKDRRLKEQEWPVVDDESNDLEDTAGFGEEPDGTLSVQEAQHQFDSLRLRLQLALDRLTTSDREVIMLAYFEQLEGPEAATRLNIAHPAYRQRLRRAIERLQRVVVKDFADLHELLNELFDR